MLVSVICKKNDTSCKSDAACKSSLLKPLWFYLLYFILNSSDGLCYFVF